MRFHERSTGQVLDFELSRVVVAGYTGRDAAAVQAHIDELADEGIPPPLSVPTFYAEGIAVEQTTQLAGVGASSSGEVEPVLLLTPKGSYVALGSDHTDRALERTDILRSKQACPKVVGDEVIASTDLWDRWDDLWLRTSIEHDGVRIAYQNAPLATLLPPGAVLRHAEQAIGVVGPGAMVFLGTVPLLTDGFRYPDAYEMLLTEPDGTVLLKLKYAVTYTTSPADQLDVGKAH